MSNYNSLLSEIESTKIFLNGIEDREKSYKREGQNLNFSQKLR